MRKAKEGQAVVNGIINVYKEKGYTSFDVVAKMRGIFRQKKIGHTGTLDPDAQGVLPVCLGTATKACGLLTDRDKEYEALLLLGTTTDTQDASGTVLSRRPPETSEEKVRAAVASFVGSYEQLPPMYSAKKVGGKKLCDLARSGVTVERVPRRVHLYEIRILDMQLPRVRMRVSCSKGTYIRTLCHDIGETLGCGGCMEELVRTRVADFSLADALRLSEIEALLAAGQTAFIRPVDTLFAQYPRACALRGAKKLLDNGNRIPKELLDITTEEHDGMCVRLYDWESRFIGLYRYVQPENDYRPLKLFAERR